mgnify:CR=1 FL=1
MRVMYVASEATPFIKSGGLADVIGSLPKETAKKDVEGISYCCQVWYYRIITKWKN